MKRREDCFFGLHFDRHSNKEDKAGDGLDRNFLRYFLSEVRPDYIQCDSKGHPGIASYASKFGPTAQIIHDPLRIWREETQKLGIALFAHYSGVFDSAAIKEHPDWAAINKDGTPSDRATSVFGAYVDKQLIPQLSELALEYGLDGAWVDGECWAAAFDYSAPAMKAFNVKYNRLPRFPEDQQLYNDFCRQGFWDYVTHYFNEMQKVAPNFQVISNWALSTDSLHYQNDLPLFYLSGDLDANTGAYSARFETKFLDQNKLPWDVMVWGFGYNPVTNRMPIKRTEQVKQECAEVISMGGGIELYYKQNAALDIDGDKQHILEIAKEVKAFCEERKPFCHRKENVKEVCILVSCKDVFQSSNKMFVLRGEPPIFEAIMANDALMDAGYHTTFSLIEKGDDLSEYTTIVVPYCHCISNEDLNRLNEYAKHGNLIIGSTNFEIKNARIVSDFKNLNRKELIKEIGIKPIVETRSKIDVYIKKDDKYTYVNLINVGGHTHDFRMIIKPVLPVMKDVHVKISSPAKPKEIILQPEGRKLNFEYKSNKIKLTLDELRIHSIVQIEYC